MDSLKRFGAKLRKHYFWVLCGVILLTAVITWSMASRELHARFEANRTKINGTYNTLKVLGIGSPNENFITGLEGVQKTLNSQVFDAWKIFGRRQNELLRWPDGVEEINKLAPDEQINETLRVNYMSNVVKRQWQRLFDKLNLRRPKPGQNTVNDFGQRVAPIEYEGIVNWDAGSRDDLLRRFQIGEIPSTTWVRLKQEDMWVYESLFDIIVEINKGATDSLNATIKTIEAIELAQWATSDVQKHPGADIEMKKEVDAMAAPVSSGLDDGIVKIPGTSTDDVAGKKLDPDMALLEGRYLDENCVPVSAEAALKNPPFSEFKQILVKMRFIMDQRKLPELLAQCANSPLPIEARQVLMHFVDIDSVTATPMGGMEQGVERPNIPADHGPYDAIVEVRGIVYIYNEPVESKLGTGSAPKPAQRLLGVPLPKKAEAAPVLMEPVL